MPENTSPPAGAPDARPAAGERIAKLLSRRGVASRREAERLIEAGEVSVNGKIITSPALNVTGEERITVSGRLLPAEEQARLWLYYKPEGLVTSASDEKGRDTVFDHLPEDMPRVMSVGRLDLNSEGLLLLTNDGGLKRRLELPSTGWLRKYRVRVNGQADDLKLQPLRDGITIEGERFKPMQVSIDRQQGANAWLTVGLREGRNREIRRTMSAIGLYVNRLIRVSYGPFRLGDLQPGQVEEVRTRVLRDQLGEIDAEQDEARAEARKPGKPAAGRPGLTRVRAGRAPAERHGESRSESRSAGRPASRSESRPERGSDLRSGGRADRRTGNHSDGRSSGPSDGRTANRSEGRPGSRSEISTGSRTGNRAGNRTGSRTGNHDENQGEDRYGKSAAASRPGMSPAATGARVPAERSAGSRVKTGPAATERTSGTAKPYSAKPRSPKPQSTRNAPAAPPSGKPSAPSGPGGTGRKGPGNGGSGKGRPGPGGSGRKG